MSTHIDEYLSQFCFDLLKVNTDDITTLGKALGECDPKRLLAVLLNTDIGWDFGGDVLDSRSGESLIRRISSVLNVMQLLYSHESCNSDLKQAYQDRYFTSEISQGSMIVPCERFEAMDSCGMMRRRIGAALIDFETLHKAQGMLNNDIKHVFSVAQIQKIKNRLSGSGAYEEWGWQKLLKSIEALSFEAWSIALDLPIWLPQTLCEFERYGVLGSVFWAMTYRGFNIDEIKRYNDENDVIQSDDDAGLEFLNTENAGAKEVSFLCADEAFYDEYLSVGEDLAIKMSDIVELLNYNCWVDFMEAVTLLADARQAA